jgi:2-polyprenyl-3-methyl-5-hydroxy-6-metoxy-1,4-benzoquinol methylase
MNDDKLNELVGQMLSDLGGAFIMPLVRIGDSLGLFKMLSEDGPLTSHELAHKTGLAERYLREWLSAMAASNYISYQASDEKFSLSEEQIAVFADENSPVYLIAAFDCAAANVHNQDKVQGVFKTGEGLRWGDQPECLFCAVAKFFRPGYQHHIMQDWLPALDGVVDKLEQGASVADVGCGHGLSTIMMAEAFPNSNFTGFDFHEGSIAEANRHVDEHRLQNVRFQAALAKEFDGEYDLVCMFDCLHDMGDPAGASAHIRSCLKQDGTLMVVEPIAADAIQDNINPVGRLYYAASTMVCVPTSLAQEVGTALGAQAGEKRLREAIVEGGGFSQFRRAAETPFNMVLEARP